MSEGSYLDRWFRAQQEEELARAYSRVPLYYQAREVDQADESSSEGASVPFRSPTPSSEDSDNDNLGKNTEADNPLPNTFFDHDQEAFRPSWGELSGLQKQLRNRLENTDPPTGSQTFTIFLGATSVSMRPVYAVLTCHAKLPPTINDLLTRVLASADGQFVTELIFKSLVTGVDFQVIRAGEVRAVEDLDVQRDSCHALGSLSGILGRILYQGEGEAVTVCEAIAPATKASSAALWGFSKTEPLYLLYFVPLVSPPITPIMHSLAMARPSYTPPTAISQRHIRSSEWLITRFSSIHTLVGSLISQKSIGGPYRTHLRMQMVQYVANQLGHSLQANVGSGSVTTVDGVNISTSDIKMFVSGLQASTFDKSQSQVNKYRKVYNWLLLENDAALELNPMVKTFKQLCRELFTVDVDSVLRVSLVRGPEAEFLRSVRSKSWDYMDGLKDIVMAALMDTL